MRRATATPPTRCSRWRPSAASWPSRSSPGLPDLLAEVALAARREQARSIGDVLLRRTRLGLLAARELVGEDPRRRPAAVRSSAWRRARAGARLESRAAHPCELRRFAEEADAEGIAAERLRRARGERARRRRARRAAAVSAPRHRAARRRSRARAGRPPVADGDRQRLAGLLQRRRPPHDARRPGGAGARAARGGRGHPGHRRGVRAAPGARRSPVEEEIERVVPLIERVAGELGAIVSVDTYKPAVARAAIAAGARIVNDVSGLRDPALAELCAQTGAALVVMHTRAAPARTPAGPGSLRRHHRRGARLPARAHRRWRSPPAWLAEQLIVDPGPDFAKTPAQTIELLAQLRPPARAGPPAADGDLAQGLHRRAHRARPARAPGGHAGRAGARGRTRARTSSASTTSPPRATSSTVRAALSGELEPGRDLALAEELRYEPSAAERAVSRSGAVSRPS